MTKILIVDDDENATLLLESMLRGEGYQLFTINESHKVLEQARRICPDLIILDLAMPEPTGFQLCRSLREDASFIVTPIIIVTALGDRDSMIVAYGAGADEYLIKPVLVEKLTATVESILNIHK
ncbi:MAG: response regulator [Chloroflexi bacterium]|nr:response regulator [Chloroflexota bacterium]